MTTAAVPRGNGEEARPDGRSPKSMLGKVGLILSAFDDGGLSLSLTELTARTGVGRAVPLAEDVHGGEGHRAFRAPLLGEESRPWPNRPIASASWAAATSSAGMSPVSPATRS
ncbi:hypothetical protein GCM10009548_65850 [Streptomyces malaysiensis subsp. malaysiensis]